MPGTSGNCVRCVRLGRAAYCNGSREECARILMDMLEAERAKVDELRGKLRVAVEAYGCRCSACAGMIRDIAAELGGETQ